MKLKEWIVDTKRDDCDCSQHVDLKVTGYSAAQGCVKYCPVCRIGFWEILVQPTPEQITFAQKTDIRARMDTMEYNVLKREPKDKSGAWGGGPTSESQMIDHLGKSPLWMSNESKEYWLKKYCAKYPNSVIAQNVKKRLEKDE